MEVKGSYGKTYEYSNEYFDSLRRCGQLDLVQVGELCCEKGYHVPDHMQNYPEITYIISGEGKVRIGEESIPVREGDFVLNLPGELHAIDATGNGSLWFLFLAFSFHDGTDETMAPVENFYASPQARRLFRDTNNLRDPIEALLKEIYSKAPGNEIMIGAYLMQAVVLCYRTALEAGAADAGQKEKPEYSPGSRTYKADSTIYSVLRYVDENIAEITSIAGIADRLGYSNAYLSHVFRDKTGVTLQNYVNHKKIEKGKELIENGRYSITHISEMLKFDSVQSFSRSFRKVTGISPTQYRKQKEPEKKK